MQNRVITAAETGEGANFFDWFLADSLFELEARKEKCSKPDTIHRFPIPCIHVYFGFTITLLCASLEVVIFIVRPLPMTLIITVFIGCASGILVLYQGLSAKIRVAEFCEDWFAVKSHGSSRRLSYSEIEDVVLDKGPWPNVVISILIRNEEEPLTLFMNVNSRILDTDLYSWLRQKIENSQRRTGLALDIVSGFYGIVITRYNGSAVMTKSVVIVYFRVKCSFPPLLSR